MPKHRAQDTHRLPLVDGAQDAHSAAERFDTSDQARAGAHTSKGGLPVALTSFVGREREVAEVEGLLADHRLLTLTGPGGSGKTRLALTVAFEVVGSFENGAWFVELAPLTDPNLVPQAVAHALGVREAPGRPLDETFFEHLQDKELLLILDNCEHLTEACAMLVDALLRSCPRMRILATSREALGVPGEIRFAVPPLSMPDPRFLPAIEGLPRYEAAGLFVERARAVRPDFEITEDNAMAVAQICCRLDGTPLAIELAAARLRVLSAEQISSRLDDRFGLLTGGGRTALAHHRTLRATMDWSHDLLPEEERILFRRLSVFAGGFALEAAEAVGSGGGIEEGEVLDLLTSLVDKSLVVAAERGGEVRYRLLETVRQYAAEKLKEAGEEDELGRRHAGFFLRFAREAEPHLKGHEQVAWLERLEREHDNLRAAMRWLLRESEVESAVRLAWALWLFWYLHGHQGEGYRYTGELLDKTNALPTVMRAKALIVRGNMSYGQEDAEGTKRLFEEAAALSRQTGNRVDLAIALAGVGVTAMQQGETQRATALFEEVLKLYREAANKWGVSYALVHLGMVLLSRGDHAGAARYFEEALAISREIGYRLSGYVSLYGLALSSRVRGDNERAAEQYIEGLGLAVEAGDKANAAYCLEGLAGLIEEGGQPEPAARVFGAAEALLEAVGAPLYVQAQDRALYEKAVEASRSRLGEEAFEAAWAQGRAMALEQAVEYALEYRATHKERPPLPEGYPAGLSAREVEVLKLLASGMTNARIAQELYISPRTVNRHLNSVYRKLGVGSRAAAARFASEHGLL
jgi:predicted ATPase/DNA-binding CsgD family transcriptional regulator